MDSIRKLLSLFSMILTITILFLLPKTGVDSGLLT